MEYAKISLITPLINKLPITTTSINESVQLIKENNEKAINSTNTQSSKNKSKNSTKSNTPNPESDITQIFELSNEKEIQNFLNQSQTTYPKANIYSTKTQQLTIYLEDDISKIMKISKQNLNIPYHAKEYIEAFF